MTDQVLNPPLATTTAEFALTVGTFRHVTVPVDADTRRHYVLAADACALLGLTGLVSTVTAGLAAETQAYLRVTEEGVAVTRLALTLDGVRQLVVERKRLGTVDDRADRFLHQVERLVHRLRARRPGAQRVSRWGWQPIRRVVRERGLSSREFVEALNALPLPGVDLVTTANYAAWSYGGCLPQESLVTRATALLNVRPEALFDAAVLTALPNRGKGRRQPTTGPTSTTPSGPAAASPPR